MKKKQYTLNGELWIYPDDVAWHFLSVPKKESSEIKKKYKDSTRGFGSLPVTVTIGRTVWKTSIFPDKMSGTYLLPVKAAVRNAEGIFDGDTVAFRLAIET